MTNIKIQAKPKTWKKRGKRKSFFHIFTENYINFYLYLLIKNNRLLLAEVFQLLEYLSKVQRRLSYHPPLF